MHARMSLMA